MIKQGHLLICSSLVILHADGLDFAAEAGVIADAQIGRHLAQTPQHTVACDLLQGALLAQRVFGVEPIRQLWRLRMREPLQHTPRLVCIQEQAGLKVIRAQIDAKVSGTPTP